MNKKDLDECNVQIGTNGRNYSADTGNIATLAIWQKSSENAHNSIDFVRSNKVSMLPAVATE